MRGNTGEHRLEDKVPSASSGPARASSMPDDLKDQDAQSNLPKERPLSSKNPKDLASEAESANAGRFTATRADRHVWALLAIFAALAIAVIALSAGAFFSVPQNVGHSLEGDEFDEVKARNSPLIDYAYLSPNATFPRTDSIRKITIHHMGGDSAIEDVANTFQDRDRQSSSNYAIGNDGRVAIYVEEANRAWTSSNSENDDQAITIEVANDGDSIDWHVGDAAFEKLIDLMADICVRNGIEELVFTGDASGNLTYHGMFNENTICPGPYLIEKMPELAERVNGRLKESM